MAVGQLRRLIELSCDGVMLFEMDALHLSSLTNLTRLHLESAGLTDLVATTFAANFTKLHELLLGYNNIKPQAVFAVVAKLLDLKVLDFGANEVVVDDAGCSV